MKSALLMTTLIGTLSVSGIVGYAASTLDGKVAKDVRVATYQWMENMLTTVEDVKWTALEKVIGKDTNDGTLDKFNIQHDDNLSAVKDVESDSDQSVIAKFSQQQAIEIAQQKVSNGEIVNFTLEHDASLTVYDIEIVKDGIEHELKIDASTGKLIEYEQDDLD